MGAVSDVYTFLLAQGLAGGSTGWDLLRRRLMDSPTADQTVVVTEDGGNLPEIREDAGIGDSALQDAGVLVTVRAGAWDGDASLTKVLEIYQDLHGKRNIVLDTTTYLRVRARTPEPIFVGFDDQGRPRHTISFLLLVDAPITV